jgi:L-ascorbate oxidase
MKDNTCIDCRKKAFKTRIGIVVISKPMTMIVRLLVTLAVVSLPSFSLLLLADAKTVEYTWTLKPRRAQAEDPSFSPDCNLDRLLLFVNDEFPGPPLYASVGDVVKVTMINESPTDALALHFHGLTMQGQPYADGAASVTQCASGPLQTQVYEFTVSDSGTHYWHGRE